MSKNYPNTTIVKNRTAAFLSQAGRCFYCNQPMWNKNLEEFCQIFRVTEITGRFLKCTAEHVIARQDGGSNQRANIVAACLYCNRTRHKTKKALSSEAYKSKVLKRMAQNKWHQIQIN